MGPGAKIQLRASTNTTHVQQQSPGAIFRPRTWSMCAASLCSCIRLPCATPLGWSRHQTSVFPTELPWDPHNRRRNREIENLLQNSQRQRRTCYALCHILYPVSAAHTSIFRMDSNSTSNRRRKTARRRRRGGGRGMRRRMPRQGCSFRRWVSRMLSRLFSRC